MKPMTNSSMVKYKAQHTRFSVQLQNPSEKSLKKDNNSMYDKEVTFHMMFPVARYK